MQHEDAKLEGKGGGKSALIWGKNAQIMVIYGLNFSYKMQFFRLSRRKNLRLFRAGPFFLVLYVIHYQCSLIPRKLPYPKNILVASTRVGLNCRITRRNCAKLCRLIWQHWQVIHQKVAHFVLEKRD